MKFKIEQCTNGCDYYFTLIIDEIKELVRDFSIAKYLGLSTLKYRNILIKNGAIKKSYLNDVIFINREDVERAIKALEPYIIMLKLTE